MLNILSYSEVQKNRNLLIIGTDFSKLGVYSNSFKIALWEVFGKWRHFQLSLLFQEMQVIRYFLCVRVLVKNLWTDCWIVTVAYFKKQPPEAFCKKRCSKKFRKFYRKTPVLESLFNKAAGPKTCNFLKKRLQHRRFCSEISETVSKKVFVNLSN